MSYEAYGEPDDEGTWVDDALNAGWVSEDIVEELRELLKLIDISNPRAGNRSDAALVLINYKLNPPPPGMAKDPHVAWAEKLLKDVI